MVDYFALLGVPRQPWLSPDLLKERFHLRSAEVHPDRVHDASPEEKAAANREYAGLNAAHQCLATTKLRLRHLLELETGAPPGDIRQTPPELMDQFFEVGRICQEVDKFLTQRDAATSPLVKARLFPQGLEWTDALQALNGRLRARLEELEGELKAVNSVTAGMLPRLEEVYRLVSYYDRWSAQLRERLVRLAC